MNPGIFFANAITVTAAATSRRVNIAMQNDLIVINPHPGERYTLAALLAACDADAAAPDDGDEWTRDDAMGEELL